MPSTQLSLQPSQLSLQPSQLPSFMLNTLDRMASAVVFEAFDDEVVGNGAFSAAAQSSPMYIGAEVLLAASEIARSRREPELPLTDMSEPGSICIVVGSHRASMEQVATSYAPYDELQLGKNTAAASDGLVSNLDRLTHERWMYLSAR